MKSITLIFLFVFLSSPPAYAEDVWKYCIGGSDLRDISVRGDTVWCAAAGSLVRWDTRAEKYTQFSRLDGLPSNDIGLIEQDGRGGVWVQCKVQNNTRTQLGRFDGRSWAVLDTTSGPGDNVFYSSLLMDRAGMLWVAAGGLFRYNGVSWKRFLPEDALEVSRSMAIDRERVMWFASSDGVYSFDGEKWRKYTTRDGLGGDNVRCAAVGPDNMKWFGTIRGVSRFDGVSWRTFTVKDSLASNTVNAVAFDASGQVWVATEGGVSRYDGASWKSWRETDNLISKKVTGLAADPSGRIWFCHGTGDSGVTAIENGKVVWYTTYNSGLPSNKVNSLVCDADGMLWFALDIGAASFDGREWKTYTTADGLKDNNVGGITVDALNRKWFLYSSAPGVTCFDGSSWRTWTTGDGLPSDTVFSVVANAGETWFATLKGVARFDGSSWVRYPNSNRLVSDTVTDMVEDADGVMWFATDKGLTRYDGSAWKTWTVDDGLSYGGVLTVRAGPEGIIWLLNSNGNLCRFDGVTFQVCPLPEGSKGKINRIAVDNNGAVWTDCLAGSVFDPEKDTLTLQMLKYEDSGWKERPATIEGAEMSDTSISALESGPDGAVWLGTPWGLLDMAGDSDRKFRTEGPTFTYSDLQYLAVDGENTFWVMNTQSPYMVMSFNGREWKVHPIPQIYFNTVGDVFVDEAGVMWFVPNYYGLVRFDGSAWTKEFPERNFPFDPLNIRSFAIDPSGRKWFGSYDEGLFCFDGAQWTHYTVADGLLSNNISDLVIDHNGAVWVKTLEGVCWYDGASWKSKTGVFWRIAVGPDKSKWFITDTGAVRYDGSSWEEFPFGKSKPMLIGLTLSVDNNNILWIGAYNGVFRFNGTAWKQYTVADGLYDDRVDRIVVDRNNVKWFASPYGFSILDDRPVAKPGIAPKELILRGNFPNPFNAGTSIAFDLYSHGTAEIDIYNIMGQKVRTIRAARLAAGRNVVLWDGRDDRGVKLSSGPCFYRVRKGGQTVKGRMMMLK